VRGDRSLLQQVWVNLLSNAIKYTRPRSPARIEVAAVQQDKELIFWVKDNGVGFDMVYADKLFGVFQRMHTVQEFEGTGVGLANVRRIIQRHGGRTWAQAERNQGAQIFFSLPAEQIDRLHHQPLATQ
jgi:two-component system, sensor histidine kinase and response regulator